MRGEGGAAERSGYPGKGVITKNGDFIGVRDAGTKSPGAEATVYINSPGISIKKIKFK